MTHAIAHAYIMDVKVLHGRSRSDYVTKFSAMAHARIIDVKVHDRAGADSLQPIGDGRTRGTGTATAL